MLLLFIAMIVVALLPVVADAAVAYRASGTVGAAASGNVTPTVPTGTAADDILVCVIETKDNISLSMPAGWTLLYSTTSGATHQAAVFWKRAIAGEPNPAITHTGGNSIIAQISGFSGCETTGSPIDVYSSTTTDPASLTIMAKSITTTVPNAMILFTIHDADNNTAHTTPGGMTSAFDSNTANGTDSSISLKYTLQAAMGATGDWTSTASGAAAAINTGGLIALIPTENQTITKDATAAAASTTSILVTMPFKGDSNTNNTYSVAYKLSTSSTWVSWTTNSAHVASPYSTTITGLTAGELYDVRATYNDADGIIGTNPQIIENIATGPTNITSAGYVTIKAAKNSIQVRAPFFNDGNNNKTFKVDYKLSPSGSWTNWVTGATATFPPYTTTITSLLTGTKYDIQVTYTDADGTAGFGTGNPRIQTVSKIVTNGLLHNSNTTLSSKWTGSRGWGYEGAKYGEIVCDTCHTKNTTNIKRIRSAITASVGAFPGSTVDFKSTTTPSGFGNDATAHATSQKICEVCHSVNSFHNYNQATAGTHQNNVDCMIACHSHNTGFSGDGSCKSCHNAAITEAYNTRQVTGAGGDFVKLSRHVNDGTATEIVTDYDCIICHAEGDAIAAAAGTGYVDTSKHRNGSSSSTRMVKLRNVDFINQTYDWNKNSITETMRTNMDTFCLNCHDSDGASGLDVNATTGLNVPAASGLTPFNSSDNLQNGRDGLTTRTRVVDVKTQLDPGTYKWNAGDANMPTGFSASNYNGNPSQHAVLGPRYFGNDAGWTATAWVNHTLRSGQTQNNASVREKAKLHCSDCHLSETNAHGATNAWHMLLNGTANDFTTDYAMGGVAPTTTASIVCYKCHSSAVYANVASTANTRFSHDREARVWSAAYGDDTATDGAVLGPLCLLCHAGDGFGNIHGVSGTYNSNGDTFARNRFMNGGYMYWDPGTSGGDAAWTDPSGTAGTCYMPTKTTIWAGCPQHTGAAGTQTVNFGRAVKY
ncbi:MAG: fibronectin type III domain-containing protein [Nitrospirota bacterium]